MRLSFLKVPSILLLGGIAATGALAEVEEKGDWVVSGDYVVGEGGVVCSSITFTANATLSGGPITIGTNITVKSGVTAAVIESVIAGTEAFTVQGAGAVNSEISFKGPNTFTGVMTITNIKFHAWSDKAFGAKEAKTIFKSRAASNDADGHAELWFHGIDTEEPFETWYSDSPVREFCYAANTTNILRGTVANKTGRVYFFAQDYAYTVLSNDWSGITYNSEVSGVSYKAHYEVFGQFADVYRINYIQGTWVVHQRIKSPYDPGKYGSWIAGNSKLIMAVTNYLAASDAATTSYAVHLWGAGTMDLNGYDQRIDEFCKYYTGANDRSTAITVTSAKPATLRCDNCRIDQVLDGKFTGQAAFVLEGNKTLTMNGASTTIGDLLITNTVGSGTANLTFATTGSWAGTNITVASGAQLTLNNAVNLAEHAKIHIGKGGCVSLTGAYTVHDLYTNGVKAAGNNTYGSSASSANVKDDDHFTGTGVMAVLEETVEESFWTGLAADGDLLKTAGNWKNSEPPDFTSGLARPVFAESGTRAVVPEETVRLGSVTFAAPEATPCFGLVPQGEDSKIAVASVTCDDADLATVRNYTNSVPTEFECAQPWNLPSSKTTLYQMAPLSSPFAVDCVKSGSGSLVLTKPAGDLTGSFTLSGGSLHLKNAAALGKMRLDITYGNKMYFYGGVISNDVKYLGVDSQSPVVYANNTTTEFAGEFNANEHYDRASYGSNSKVIFSGGVKNSGSWRAWGGYLVFTNKPCQIAAFNGYYPKIEFWSTNNTFGIYGGTESFTFAVGGSGTTVELHAPYAVNTNAVSNFAYLVPFITARENNTYKLFGNDQQFAHVQEWTTAKGQTWTITSDKPAQMKFYQDQDHTLTNLLVTGAAGLTLNGPNALTLTGRTCTTTGALEVEDGTLTLGADESFPNVRTVRVSGGTLALTSAGQLDRRVNLYVSGSGKISIPDGVTLEVRRLYVNGVSQKMGDYTEGVVTGGGKVHVPGGAAVILR